MTAIGSATASIQIATARFDAASQQTLAAVDGSSPVDPVGPVVDQIAAVEQLRASLKVMEAGNAMQKAALDIKA